ncbi:HET domain containing protein [Pyrenophora tritici-repentis]|nr:HET domain containing protein [Pyrenophora tritici-repentis]KAI1535753.1 HET domain containing protein [Pyrenophora tritici-repentis]KAI1565809.1 HET domain containing protein [Pyrenophora tritici-repentis]KAI1569069.1 HET domain containing protein [Pyrenophora tritici-repentis]KAI1581434.1 HET domain containing protein [Pyrenophora tritici-repentis]
MKSDLNKTFREIFDNDGAALYKQLFQVREFQLDRKESERWMQRPRFLKLYKPSDFDVVGKETDGSRPRRTIALTSREEDNERIGRYIAVSWRWIKNEDVRAVGCNTQARFDYYIKRPGEKSYKTEFPDWFMDRVWRFAESKGIHKIWIDTDCIFQRPGDEGKYPEDKKHGVQAMDLVYGGSLAVGLLTKSLTKQADVDMLAALLSEQTFTGFQLKEDTVQGMLKVIRHVLSDDRWDRGWIFQEDHLASKRMTLLIPHSENISKSHLSDVFGELLGDLTVNLAQFRRTVTMFCQACSKSGEHRSLKDILDKVKQYNQYDVQTTTTLRVLDDVCSRSLKLENDRPAIFANALRFKYRLDTSEDSSLAKSDKFSMSVVFLTLILKNGEIFNNNISTLDILSYTLRSLLKKLEFKIDAPRPDYKQTFVDHCRFPSPEICAQGIKTNGILWNLRDSKLLNLNPGEKMLLKRYQSMRHRGARLSERGKAAIELLARKLARNKKTKRLSIYLRRKIKLDKPGEKATASTNYILNNLYALSGALLKGHELSLGSPDTETYGEPEDTAIFITKRRDFMAFTSWEEGPDHGQERLASLLVTTFHGYEGVGKKYAPQDSDEEDAPCVLKNRGWVNGVWVANSGVREKVVFPVPGILEGCREVGRGVKRKRKA